MEIKEINIENEIYPVRLREIKNPPKKLYLLGDEKILNSESISIIGSRECSDYGAEIARNFAKSLAQNEFTITSGMAKGIDSNAHLGAIEGKGKTIAVLGSGFNHVFPDRRVYEEILKNGGAVITEYEKNVGVFPQGFRDRNRIVAGLSIGTLVVEAKEHSGTSITAEYVKKYKRKLFCIPHEINNKLGIGTNRLLKNGAILVTETQDILKHFNRIQRIEEITEKLEIEIPEEYKKLYDQIEGEMNANEISKKIKMNISEVNTILTMLELEGYILRLPGNYFRRKKI